MRELDEIFPLKLPSSAELEEAAQKLEQLAVETHKLERTSEAGKPDPDTATLFLMAAAAYRQVFEERQTREALRALLLKQQEPRSVFEAVFGRSRD